MSEDVHVLASSKPWYLTEFASARERLPGRWIVVTNPADLEVVLQSVKPRYVFFPHWSHKVPADVLGEFECVCFHMTDLPYGRGGSPLQNLIARGHKDTRVTALRMTDVIDGGPVYAKRPLSLEGSAEQIFARAASIISEMIQWIVTNRPEPTPQDGEPVAFARRKQDESRIETMDEASRLYDHIRMLDATGYPKAFIDHQGWRLEFDRAQLDGEQVEARVRFTKSGASE